MDITIREAEPREYQRLGDLTAQAYLADGLLELDAEDSYLLTLRDVARRAAASEVLVAVDADGTLLGGVTFVPGSGPWADIAGPGESEFRMLAVDRSARGLGVGQALVDACVARARAREGCVRIVLSTQRSMRAAHRIYERMGFVRTPERDWEPYAGPTLITYALGLQPSAAVDG
ncbi:GNAT family N-acetyltransferase [Streptomyces sp. NPDC088124]|uniref:GNAT family N-acetyltransferase n=1 Tax=Streptomyces sp. NPDC088124 TaxID=3154654 RepID=UPI00343B088B